MDVKEIRTRSGIDAVVDIPGSKSYTNRALVCSALAGGSLIRNPGYCDDTRAMIEGLRSLGARMECSDEEIYVDSSLESLHPAEDDVDVGPAGTAMRFLTGLCTLIPGEHRLVGTEGRPIKDLVDALGQIIDGEIYTENDGCPPVRIKTYGLSGGEVLIRVNKSSQYLSSLLMAAPYAVEDVLITPLGEFVERPYIDMTLETMRPDVEVKKEGWQMLVRSGQSYMPREQNIESDASGGTYFMAAAPMAKCRVSVGKFKYLSRQADLRFADILESMGCRVWRALPHINVKWVGELHGVEVDMRDMPDAVPTLAVVAAVAEGPTKITGIRNLRIKECDRIGALQAELAKTGIRTEASEDSMIVYGGEPHGAEIETYNDHRMAMSFSELGLRVPGIRIKNPGCVSKSFPDFYELFDRL